MAKADDVVRDAQHAAARVVQAGLPPDMTAVILVVPVYRRAIADPHSGWREDVFEAMKAAIDRSHPPAPRIHIIGGGKPS